MDAENNKDVNVAMIFPRWLGDCIMARGALYIAKDYFPTVNFIPVVEDEIRENLKIPDAIEGIPRINSMAIKHHIHNIHHIHQLIKDNSSSNKQLLSKLELEEPYLTIFLHKNKDLKKKLECKKHFYDEDDLRSKNGSLHKHRVSLYFEFICDSLNENKIYPNRDIRNYQPVRYSLTPEEKPIKKNLIPNKVRIFLSPFSVNHNQWKGLEIENILDFIQKINENYSDKIHVFLLAKQNYKKEIEKITSKLNGSSESFTGIIPNNLKDFFEIAASMDYFVTIDSGSLHVAELMDIPSCGLYGPTDENETGPFQEQYKREKHCVCRRNERLNPNLRVDKKIRLSSSLSADDIYNEVIQHLKKLNLI